jgi:hypothetical protein
MSERNNMLAANAEAQVFRFLDLPKELRLMVYERIHEKRLQKLPLPGCSVMCDDSAQEIGNLLRTCKLVHSGAGPFLKTDRKLALVHQDCVLAVKASKEDKVPVGYLLCSLVEVLKTAHLYDKTHLAKLPINEKQPIDINWFTFSIPLRQLQTEPFRQYQNYARGLKPDVLTEEFKDLFRMMVLQIRRSQTIELRWYVPKAANHRLHWHFITMVMTLVEDALNKSDTTLKLRLVIVSADEKTQRQVRSQLANGPSGRAPKGIFREVMPEEEWQAGM